MIKTQSQPDPRLRVHTSTAVCPAAVEVILVCLFDIQRKSGKWRIRTKSHCTSCWSCSCNLRRIFQLWKSSYFSSTKLLHDILLFTGFGLQLLLIQSWIHLKQWRALQSQQQIQSDRYCILCVHFDWQVISLRCRAESPDSNKRFLCQNTNKNVILQETRIFTLQNIKLFFFWSRLKKSCRFEVREKEQVEQKWFQIACCFTLIYCSSNATTKVS